MDNKKSEEALAEIYRNTQLALQSISDILPEAEDERVREELMRQHEEYEKIGGKAALLAKDKGIELKEPNPLKKAMMWGSIKMNTMTDNSPAHLAEMLVQGTVMGITSLKTTLGEMTDESSDEDVKALLAELVSLEEGFESKWKSFL